MRRLVVVGAILIVVGGGVIGFVAWQGGVTLPGADYCEASGGDTVARLDPDQAHYAALITAVAVRRELPARAASIALAAAYQES